jgi:DNA replication protein DnaC
MKTALEASLLAEIKLFSHEMKLPTVGRECGPMADQIRRAGDDPLLLVHGLLAAEHRDRCTRRASRRAKEAHFPLLKTLEGYDFRRNPALDEGRIRALANCEFARNGEPVLFVGGTGTGKTHLAIALAHAACALGIATRFSTTAALVNELVEAQESRQLSRVVARYARFDLLVLDELGYLPLSSIAAQLLFQVIAERGERRSTIVTTNLPFSEWTTVIEDPRLCRAFVERITYRTHIIETGDRSIRLEDMMAMAAGPGRKGGGRT